jgi:hypothetical protein
MMSLRMRSWGEEFGWRLALVESRLRAGYSWLSAERRWAVCQVAPLRLLPQTPTPLPPPFYPYPTPHTFPYLRVVDVGRRRVVLVEGGAGGRGQCYAICSIERAGRAGWCAIWSRYGRSQSLECLLKVWEELLSDKGGSVNTGSGFNMPPAGLLLNGCRTAAPCLPLLPPLSHSALDGRHGQPLHCQSACCPSPFKPALPQNATTTQRRINRLHCQRAADGPNGPSQDRLDHAPPPHASILHHRNGQTAHQQAAQQPTRPPGCAGARRRWSARC